DVDKPNRRYGDQLCNVQRAFQALSIDDDREWIFTPLLLGREHQFADCPLDWQPLMLDAKSRLKPGGLQEVWFAGAHSDIGGGYTDSALGGVSLNWMIERLAEAGADLLPANARSDEDVYGRSHDPEDGLLWSPLYHQLNRNLVGYARDPRELPEL